MSLDKLKLSKALVASMTDAGYLTPKEIQAKTMSRILGGQDVIAIGPEGCGKTTTYVLATLMKLKYGFEEAPRALILVPDKERVEEVVAQFNLINRNSTFRIIGIHADANIETQVNEITDGVDIVVAVPDRARAIYLKLGLNMNKVQMFIVDNAELIVKNGLQLPVNELANSAKKCQHLVFSEVYHDKLEKMISPFIREDMALIEVEDLIEPIAQIHHQLLYPVPNFKTKLNLLNLLLKDEEVFTKTVVFVNTRLTAQTLLRNIYGFEAGEITMLNPLFYDDAGFQNIDEFKDILEAKVLIVANESDENVDIKGIPNLIHFELPEQKETFLKRIVKNQDSTDEVLSFTFASDSELIMVKKIEQAIGYKIDVLDLPDDLKIENVTSKNKAAKKKQKQLEEEKEAEERRAAAFHEKKASNTKNYNYSAGKKAEMTYKKKKGLG